MLSFIIIEFNIKHKYVLYLLTHMIIKIIIVYKENNVS